MIRLFFSEFPTHIPMTEQLSKFLIDQTIEIVARQFILLLLLQCPFKIRILLTRSPLQLSPDGYEAKTQLGEQNFCSN